MASVPHPYLPSTDDQREEMLRAIGVAAATDLFADIPEAFRDPDIRLPDALSELELRRDLEALAAENRAPGSYASFLGAGAYRHFIPAVVRAMASRGELLTSYTPYQPEVSQGTLQATYDFQSLICLLTGMDVANAGMYDGATALAEAALMACRVTGRGAVVALDTVNPRYLEVVRTYCAPQGISWRSRLRDRRGWTILPPACWCSTRTSWARWSTWRRTGRRPTTSTRCWRCR